MSLNSSQPVFQEGDDLSGSLPSAFAGVRKGEEKSASSIIYCLSLKFSLPPLNSQDDYMESWILLYFKDAKWYDNAHCWMLSKVQSNWSKTTSRETFQSSVLSTDSDVQKPLLWTSGFPTTARLHQQKYDCEWFFMIFVERNKVSENTYIKLINLDQK